MSVTCAASAATWVESDGRAVGEPNALIALEKDEKVDTAEDKANACVLAETLMLFITTLLSHTNRNKREVREKRKRNNHY